MGVVRSEVWGASAPSAGRRFSLLSPLLATVLRAGRSAGGQEGEGGSGPLFPQSFHVRVPCSLSHLPPRASRPDIISSPLSMGKQAPGRLSTSK